MTILPAIRIRQFGVNFYGASLTADVIDRLVTFEILSYTKGSPDVKVAGRRSSPKINWELLESRIRASAEAYQRPIIGKKIEGLIDYYKLCSELNTLPAIPGPVLLVSERRLEFKPVRPNVSVGNLEIPDEGGVLRVLDGQHRLLALHQAKLERRLSDFDVPAALFDPLPGDHTVELFVTINAKHTRLNPSHLVSLAGKRLYRDEMLATAHDVIRALNESSGSPLAGQIKILGIGPGKISQAALADEIKTIFTAMAAGGSRFQENAKAFFLAYFKQIARVFEKAWNGRKYSIKTGTALRAFIRVVPDVVRIMREKREDLLDARAIHGIISQWATTISDARFETEGAWKQKVLSGTQSTVDLLARELRAGLERA
jgi:DGQHR domain-containing protein